MLNTIHAEQCRVLRSLHARAQRRSLKSRRNALKKSSDLAAGAATVIERRAADVLVLGNSAAAFATAYSLAKRGKKVSVALAVGQQGLQHGL